MPWLSIRSVTACGLLLFTAACAHHRPDRFYKEGVSQEQYQKDAYECERDTRQSAASFGRGYIGASQAQDFAIRCMMARGYSYGQFYQN